MRTLLARVAAEVLKVDPAEIELTEDLTEYGFDSIALTQFSNRLNETIGLDLTPGKSCSNSRPRMVWHDT